MIGDLQATFIVRLRRERGTPAGEWRGEVEHVQSARRARFVDKAALSAFVWSMLEELESHAGRTQDGDRSQVGLMGGPR